MIYRFPWDSAYLPRTKLAYVNLPGILSDGKRDRQARVPGFVAVQLGERCFMIFMRQGEPFFAARITPAGRGPAALSEVLRLCATESERGEGGQIGYYGASEDQLRAMLSTVVHEPLPLSTEVDPARPDLLFPKLRERGFSGVLELCDGGRKHYLVFQDGGFRTGWFTERDESMPIPDFLRGLFTLGAGLAVGLYPALDALPVQAGPGFVDLYRRIIGGTLREVALATGRETALGIVQRGQGLAALEHPVVASFDITPEGRVMGDPVASPEKLTDGVARWMTEVLIAAADHHGVDPAGVVEKVGRDSRFVLQEHGFFARLPWALSI
ncbi:hypothetical protein [Longimicrobium sp.]|uniref:hypothetical protein n=1 Tax=Longimicrobium sp. TaxID=2029185 RepID=UPI002E304731|nr:hypothetical protein [Longimicrobium sp.]HEX6039012.1 hypothetical protein [Longimicrobium sp.]